MGITPIPPVRPPGVRPLTREEKFRREITPPRERLYTRALNMFPVWVIVAAAFGLPIVAKYT